MTPLARLQEKIGPMTESGCQNWLGAHLCTGYGAFRLNGKTIASHRASYLLQKGEIPKGLYVCHSCDNRVCVNPNHLWLGTPQENVLDMVKKNRHKPARLYGERHPQAKLTEMDIPKIKELARQGQTQRELAKEFNVSQRTIWGVLHAEVWRS